EKGFFVIAQDDVWLISIKWALIYRDTPDATRPYPFRYRFCLFLGSWLQERSNEKLETSRVYPSHLSQSCSSRYYPSLSEMYYISIQCPGTAKCERGFPA